MEQIDRNGRAILTIISLFTAFSILLLFIAWYASDLAPRLMYRNYATVKYAAEMQRALTSIYLDASNGRTTNPETIKSFDWNLLAEKQNITEIGEGDNVLRLEKQWTKFRELSSTPTLEEFQRISATLDELAQMNEQAMLAYEREARTLGKAVLFGGFLALALVIVYSVQVYLMVTEQFRQVTTMT